MDYVFAGEFSLTGAEVPVSAALAIALAVARDQPGAQLVFPAACADIAACVPGLAVWAARSLPAVVAHFSGSGPLPCAVASVPEIAASPAPFLLTSEERRLGDGVVSRCYSCV